MWKRLVIVVWQMTWDSSTHLLVDSERWKTIYCVRCWIKVSAAGISPTLPEMNADRGGKSVFAVALSPPPVASRLDLWAVWQEVLVLRTLANCSHNFILSFDQPCFNISATKKGSSFPGT